MSNEDSGFCAKAAYVYLAKVLSYIFFVRIFKDRGLLEDTIHMSIKEKVAMFLNTMGHNVKNRLVATNFDMSGETVSCYFNKVFHANGELRNELILTLRCVVQLYISSFKL